MKYSSAFARLAVLGAAASLAACSSPDGPRVLKDLDRIIASQNELSTATFDLSRVVVVRLRVDNEMREVTSLLPVIAAESRTPDGVARTIFRIDQKSDTLTLFTRDAKSKVAYRADVPVKDPAGRPSLMFPVLDGTGNAVNRKISVEAVFAR